MILDTLENASCYEGVHPSFRNAFEWLRSCSISTPDGRFEIDGDSLFAIVQRYDSAAAFEKKWESHRIHGDIQYLLSGSEKIGYAERRNLTIRTPYEAMKDAEFYEPPASSSFIRLSQGSFAVFLPHDAHQPGIMSERPEPIIKVVIKFRL
jgi:YhcH/YjgK/YiaL family protein